MCQLWGPHILHTWYNIIVLEPSIILDLKRKETEKRKRKRSLNKKIESKLHMSDSMWYKVDKECIAKLVEYCRIYQN